MVHTEGVGVVEPVQVLLYEAGQEYQAHYDWWVSEQKGKHSRFMTYLLYLNSKLHTNAGGDTAFPKAKCTTGVYCNTNGTLAVHPGKGSAVFFYNLLEDGNPDEMSLHSA